jgi:vacuolar protein sorting-associated protein 26
VSSDFHVIGRELEPLGALAQDKEYKFKFKDFEKQYESYYGNQVKLTYYLRVTVGRSYASKITKFKEVFVSLPQTEPKKDQKPLKMEVGIEDCLHIEFEFPKNHYHLKDCLVGNVSFKLVKINIKYMEVNIIRRESTGMGKTQKTVADDIAKFQIMDGCPFKSTPSHLISQER